ncbi:hypothetical protein HMPREF0541_02055 [Lacticaseibacillus rhamnosus ATCC 21052]|nr:hypothetical protein HMPREF0541_02055 [Lacticaseibacillus rhamnosus ATCC 21052]
MRCKDFLCDKIILDFSDSTETFANLEKILKCHKSFVQGYKSV